MRKIIISSIFFFFCITLFCIAEDQETVLSYSKMNVELRYLLKQYRQYKLQKTAKSLSSLSNMEERQALNLVINSKNSKQAKAILDSMGIATHIITSNTLTAYVPIEKIEEVSLFPCINKIVGLRKRKLLTEKARETTGTDLVHNGYNMETPYTGKGVIIGVVDCGIEYDHLAFRESEDSTRIIAAWNLGTEPTSPIYGSSNIIATGTDGTDENHGTHVTGIAAGGKTIGSSKYYGMAPNAEIVAVGCSDLSDANLLNGINLVRKVAESQGKPWVANMSLGSNLHSHDGYDYFSLILDSMVLNGGHIVSAAGNEGDDYIHAMHTFNNDGEKAYFLIKNDDDYIFCHFVSEDTTEYEFRPYIYNKSTKNLTSISPSVWTKSESEIDTFHNEYSNRYETDLYVSLKGGDVNILESTQQKFVVCITGRKGQTVHGWIEPGYFDYSGGSLFVDPDNYYQINSPAIGRNIIGVGSYTSSTSYKNYKNKTFNGSGTIGKLSSFSSVGPSLDDLEKPDVCAPGQLIVSSYNGKNNSFSLNNYIVEIDSLEGEKYYYGIMQGTSMATPAVTGIIALWLEANPYLTHNQLLEVIYSTSSAFSGQIQGEWDYRYGYGKIEAYEGLKAVLGISSGISTPHNTEKPVSILKTNHQWRILFNSNENFANISIYTIDGRKIQQHHLLNPKRGEEKIISFDGLSKGLYIINITTRNSSISRKIII